MNSPRSENKGDSWFQKFEAFQFTEEDKVQVIETLHIMAKALAEKNRQASNSYAFLLSKLYPVPPSKAQECLLNFLTPQLLTSVSSVRSFIFLKKSLESLPEENQMLEKKLAEKIVMNLNHIIFYKTLPCPKGNFCKHYPRKIVHKNDFQDVELDCYFYHHEKDRRRFVINNNEKEFSYAGNFGDGKKGEKNGFSRNFFESLFHPLYYKNFKCVRTKCEESVFCPYFHSEEEKTIWAVEFKMYFGKDREMFNKKKISGEEDNFRRMKKKAQFSQRIAFQNNLISKY